MLTSEIYRVLTNKKSIFFICLLIVIPFLDLLMNISSSYLNYWLHPEAYGEQLSKKNLLHPAAASFLSGSSMGHIAQMLLIWILPLYLLLIYSDFYILEKKIGYSNITYSRFSRKDLLKNRFLLSFLLPFIILFTSLLLNFVLALIIFRGGQSFLGMEMYVDSHGHLLALSLKHPYVTYMIYLLVFSILAGCYGVMCLALSLLLPNYKYVYPIAFLIWIIQIMSPYSLSYLMQPFIEYGFKEIIPASIIFFAIIAIFFLSAWRYKVKYDEI